MIIDIRFVDIAANKLLIERVVEHIAVRLGDRTKHISSISIRLDATADDSFVGECKFALTDGRELKFEKVSSRFLQLIDASLNALSEHLVADVENGMTEPAGKQLAVTASLTDQQVD